MKKYNIGNFIFFALLIVVGASFYLIPNKPAVSDKENRNLAPRPEFSEEALLSGQYASDYETYFSDNFPFREQLIDAANRIKEFKGTGGEDDFQFVVVDGDDNAAVTEEEEEQTEEEESTEQDEEILEEERQDRFLDDGIKKNGVFICGDTALTKVYQVKSVVQAYTKTINDFAAAHPNINTYCGVIPIASAYYLPEKYQNENTDQKKMIDNVYGMLNSNVKTIDIYSNLKKHDDEYIYFRTDHHWTATGAYYAYQQFMREQGEEVTDINDLNIFTTYDRFLGTLYNKVGGNQAMRNNPDKVVVYDLPVKSEAKYWTSKKGGYYIKPLFAKNINSFNKYLAFTYGDHGFIQIDTETKNGKSILIVKDSFGNAFSPFLTMNYEHVYILDPRYPARPRVSAFIEENGVDDVLFLTNITNSSVMQRVKEIRRVVTQ